MTDEKMGRDDKGPAPGDLAGVCTGPDCCRPSGIKNRWKMLISLLILGAAGVVMAYSVSRKNARESDPARQGTSATGPASMTGSNKASGPRVCGLTQETIGRFADMSTGYDAGFVLVPGNDADQAQVANKQIEAAVRRIEARGNDVVVFSAEGNAGNALHAAGSQGGPCVIAIRKGSRATMISGPITVEKLVRAFVAATRPPSSCSADCACK